MADVMDVNPTRGNLLRLKSELADTRTRHDLLDRKREVLVHELMDRLDEAERLENKNHDLFQAAHEALHNARMRMGKDRVDWISLCPTVTIKVRRHNRSVMGLPLPGVDIEIQRDTPPYGLNDTSSTLDEAREQWIEVLRFLSNAAETMVGVWRIAMELRKTQRQVKALETVRIPRYEATVQHIAEHLEEAEREDIVTTRKIRDTKD